MPRCGQMSRSAQTAPVSARPRIIGSPSMVFAVIWPRFSALPGNAKYQASRSGAAASDSMAPVDLPAAGSKRAEATLAAARSGRDGASLEPPRHPARGRGGSKIERGSPGWLGGLPIAIKDLMNVTGVRSTRGSPIFADFVPDVSDVQVETLERRGGIVVARSNTSEFGAGAN